MGNGIPKRELIGLPNYLTYARILVVPAVIVLMMMIDDSRLFLIEQNQLFSWIVASLVIVAGVSDVIDGHYARKYNFRSAYGKFLDPLADKLMSFAVLIMLVQLDRLAGWIAIILISRDVIITGLRGVAADAGLVVAASYWGKKKTAMMTCALVALLIHYPFWVFHPQPVSVILVFLTLIISVGSGFHYIWKVFSRVLQTGAKPELDSF